MYTLRASWPSRATSSASRIATLDEARFLARNWANAGADVVIVAGSGATAVDVIETFRATGAGTGTHGDVIDATLR